MHPLETVVIITFEIYFVFFVNKNLLKIEFLPLIVSDNMVLEGNRTQVERIKKCCWIKSIKTFFGYILLILIISKMSEERKEHTEKNI